MKLTRFTKSESAPGRSNAREAPNPAQKVQPACGGPSYLVLSRRSVPD